MDIKALTDGVVEKVKSNPDALKDFKADPKKAITGLLGNIDLDDNIVATIVNLVKEKLNLGGDKKESLEADDKKEGGIGDIVGKLGDVVGGILGKKED